MMEEVRVVVSPRGQGHVCLRACGHRLTGAEERGGVLSGPPFVVVFLLASREYIPGLRVLGDRE